MKTHAGCMCGRRGETRSHIARFMNRRAPAKERYRPTDYEHAANCVTHALWILPSTLGSLLLHRRAAGPLEGVTACVYGLGLCALFTVSTLFHTISWRKSHLQRVEQCFHMCDRVTIYFFIAASYAPWLNLRELGPWAAHMRWLVWVMACAGTIYVCLYHERYKLLELLCYATMGLCPALVILSSPEQDGVWELALGGALYALGVVFFKSDGLVPFAHAIWHVFVVLGATVHYFAIWRHLYGRGAGGVDGTAAEPLGVRVVWDF
ncbi:monocyte to macrophage differentiation factor 2-like isoform X1 [Lethenteron reissneri]|uniref:monocyte to macrophage differentiation factor 2-like isoform X1 n=2 Tax=Lethenteron reissneri TaxID=7753 RepID=UPI002AB798CA|nr:monocyte to macrophage differentiation factor 2-like isoform X1 [Lethenteron reissneri]